MQFNTPILFLIFNRPEQTKAVFSQIRSIKPKFLYVAADGPRTSKPGEFELCTETRNIVLNNINWDCEVKMLFREENLGCGVAVSSAINWFFENVEEGIILEDDCFPHITFFHFCEIMLERYRHDEHVMNVSGSNLLPDKKWGDGSYFFSYYPFIWGWATWRRAWRHYDYKMKSFPSEGRRALKKIFHNDDLQVNYWIGKLEDSYKGMVDTWDYQYLYSVWINEGISIRPNVNLISNIGFDSRATHTKGKNNKFSKMAVKPYKFDKVPSLSAPFQNADDELFDYGYIQPSSIPLQGDFKSMLVKMKIFLKAIVKK